MEAPIARAERLEEAGPSELSAALRAAVFAVVCTVLVLTVFDWDVESTLLGALAGTPIWGAVYYWEYGRCVPREMPMEAPRDIPLASGRDRLSIWHFAVLAACGFAFSAIADASGLGAAFLPGLFSGGAVASTLTAVRVRRWERSHGRRLLVDPDTNRPYAGAAL